MRIIACPIKGDDSSVNKDIYRYRNKPDGFRYIIIGDHHVPGLMPSRIIVGPKTKSANHIIDSCYPMGPRVELSAIPIR